MAHNVKTSTRERLRAALQRELMGPSAPDEELSEFPKSRYIVGRLAPARAHDGDDECRIEDVENDSLGAGADDDETAAEETQTPLIIGFHPASMGLSFLVDKSCDKINVIAEWGDYKREKKSHIENTTVWRRYQRTANVCGIAVNQEGKLPQILLSSAMAPPGVTVTGVDDMEVSIEGVVYAIDGMHAVSLFLVNRRTEGEADDRTKDERWLFQPRLEVRGSCGGFVFRAKTPFSSISGTDPEVAISSLLYKHVREFASGHGVSVGWEEPVAGEDGTSTCKVFTDYMPSHEVPSLIAPVDQTGGAQLDMKELAEAGNAGDVQSMLSPMLDAYEQWIQDREQEALGPEIATNPEFADAANICLQGCRKALDRMRAGLQLLFDQQVFEAFQFANRTMWDQRIHTIWANENRRAGELTGTAFDWDKPNIRTWRPFQMGFILLNIVGIAEEKSGDRQLVDLLWFPTGGGKTEAYLGLAAFTLALRRRRGNRHGLAAGAGVSIIMRYTLRLLTVQQFQRATALIAACEVVRRSDPERWGKVPFRIGLWVGQPTTPNTFADSHKALEEIVDGKRPRKGSPVQLVTCPRCGISLVNEAGKPENQTYQCDTNKQRTLIWCRNPACDFCARKSNNEGLPVVLIDDEIYRTCPSIVIATVDKFARLPFKGQTQSLFGKCNRYSATYGHLTEADGDKIGGRKIKDAQQVRHLLPPDLIIQDELHLISGPLGTMVGLYETAVDRLCCIKDGDSFISPKVIASTATIRRAQHQARQLFARPLAVFPPSGVSSKDSFFAKEKPIDPEDDDSAGRLFVGVNAPGSSTKTLLVRTYSILLASAQAEIDDAVAQGDPGRADPYGTLVGYFNSLRALGGAKRLVEDDISNVRLRYLDKQRGFPRRTLRTPEELTSRLDSWKIPGLLKRLDNTFPRGNTDWPVDVLLATNMISVGVDIDRLGLMVVTGQPKSTAEYIQATSRVGRKHPGIVVTMYNWLGARDLSHYERFRSYHAALYRYVEAISVTPYSSRALDRGLRGVFTAINRIGPDGMAQETSAANFDPADAYVLASIDEIEKRAAQLVGHADASLVRGRLLSHRDEWAQLAADPLRYSWLREDIMPTGNSRVLLKTMGTANRGAWPTPGSMREVEPSAAFYFAEDME